MAYIETLRTKDRVIDFIPNEESTSPVIPDNEERWQIDGFESIESVATPLQAPIDCPRSIVSRTPQCTVALTIQDFQIHKKEILPLLHNNQTEGINKAFQATKTKYDRYLVTPEKAHSYHCERGDGE